MGAAGAVARVVCVAVDFGVRGTGGEEAVFCRVAAQGAYSTREKHTALNSGSVSVYLFVYGFCLKHLHIGMFCDILLLVP